MTRIKPRVGLALAVFLMGCAPVSYSQFQSESRAEVGLNRKVTAENQAIALATSSTAPVAYGDEIRQILALESARRALAEDARADFRAATSPWFNATVEDRVVALSRAGRKGWYAGAAIDAQLALDIREAGLKACAQQDGQVASRLPRDCELISYLPLLTALQKSWDTILDIDLETTMRLRLNSQGLRPDEAAALIRAIVDMNQTSAEVARVATQRSDVRAWLTREQVLYYCSFSSAISLLGQDSSPKGARDASDHAQAAGLPNTSDLKAILAEARIEESQIAGIYGVYSNRVKGLPGTGGLNIGNGLVPDRKQCRDLR